MFFPSVQMLQESETAFVSELAQEHNLDAIGDPAPNGISRGCMSTDGKIVVLADDSGDVYFYELQDNVYVELDTYGTFTTVRYMACDDNGSVVAIGGDIGGSIKYVRVFKRSGDSWNIYQTIGPLDNSGPFQPVVDLSHDGDLLIIGERAFNSNAGRALIYNDNGSFTLAATLTESGSDNFGTDVSIRGSGGQLAAVASHDGVFIYEGGWTLTTQERSGHTIIAVSVSQTTDALITADDHRTRIYEKTGEPLSWTNVHSLSYGSSGTNNVLDLDFSSDGRGIAAYHDNHGIRLYGRQSGIDDTSWATLVTSGGSATDGWKKNVHVADSVYGWYGTFGSMQYVPLGYAYINALSDVARVVGVYERKV